jgi:tetratricopeptide (TPR) repeat protein
MESLLTKLRCKWRLFCAKKKYEALRYEEALELVQKVVKAQSRPALALLRAGSCLRGLRRYDEAIDCYERALQIVPNYGEAHAYLSLVLVDLGRNHEALESINRAIRIKPSLVSVAKLLFWQKI